MKYLPTDVSEFQTMIEGNYIYVDKTQYLYRLFTKGAPRYYFLSRPRRFGKTLLISTLKELFSANRALFKGLWIDASDYEWIEYPVIDLDFSGIDHRTLQELEMALTWTLNDIAQHYQVDISDAPTLGTRLIALIKRLAKRGPIVLLIDEYDKPIIDHLNEIPKAIEQRDFLKGLYDVIKSMSKFLRAIFITGVSKFSKTSLFSGLNNLNDITTDPRAASLLGYTDEEIDLCFKEYCNEAAQHLNMSIEELREKMRYWYNGYRFSEEPSKVYNPFSVLHFLEKRKFSNYWFTSGTSYFLVELLKKQYTWLQDIEQLELSPNSLSTFDLNNVPLIPLLFQAGYLTFDEYKSKIEKFTLAFPNYEVEDSFKKYLVATLSNTSDIKVDSVLSQLIRAVIANDLGNFFLLLETLFAHIPYTLHMHRESYFHALFQFLLSLLSLEAQSEIITDVGRIDLVLITRSHVYVFELKVGINPEVALEQIQDRKYYQKFIGSNKQIALIGLSFYPEDDKTHLRYVEKDIKIPLPVAHP
jgi:hypothetical protein